MYLKMDNDNELFALKIVVIKLRGDPDFEKKTYLIQMKQELWQIGKMLIDNLGIPDFEISAFKH